MELGSRIHVQALIKRAMGYREIVHIITLNREYGTIGANNFYTILTAPSQEFGCFFLVSPLMKG